MFIIAGRYRRQRLITPKSHQTRPTANRLREAIFNICQHTIEGTHFLDIFAGSGAIGFEALSRGAQFVTFIETHKEAIQCIKANIAHLGVEDQTKILHQEAFTALKWLQSQKQTFDIIYADPPYQTFVPYSSLMYSAQIIQWIDTHPLLNCNGRLFVEEDFRSEPNMHPLTTLSLKDNRRFGHTVLQQYQLKGGCNAEIQRV